MNQVQAASTALLLRSMEKPEEKAAKVDLFEAVVYQHYLDGQKDNPTPISAEDFLRKGDNGKYLYLDLNTAWWGFQAGFEAACIAGAKS